MRKNLLMLVLILLVTSSPCYSQTIHPEPQSIGNTLWMLLPQNVYFGFADGQVYVCDRSLTACTPAENSFYSDFLFFALFYIPIREDNPGFVFGFLPAGSRRGRVIVYNYRLRYALRGSLLLVSDTWTP